MLQLLWKSQVITCLLHEIKHTCIEGLAGQHIFLTNILLLLDLPHIEFEISASGLLLSSQSLTFECRANIVDDLIELPSLWLEAPNGTSLTQTSSATTLHYTLPSLDTSDGGVYTCVMVLVIAGSGINRQRKVMKEITVVGMSICHYNDCTHIRSPLTT